MNWQRTLGNLSAKGSKEISYRIPYALDELVAKNSCEKGGKHERAWEEIELKQEHKTWECEAWTLRNSVGRDTHDKDQRCSFL